MNAKELGAQSIANTRHTISSPWGSSRTFGNVGLTKRELFAAMAMQGFLADSSQRLIHEAIKEGPNFMMLDDEAAVVAQTNVQLAHGCVALADVLLAELAKDQTP